MAFTNTTTQGARQGLPVFDRFAEFFEGIRDGWNRYWVYRNTLTELRSLSRRELADLGISHSMITRVALETAYGKTDAGR